jgi:hypothetical protein
MKSARQHSSGTGFGTRIKTERSWKFSLLMIQGHIQTSNAMTTTTTTGWHNDMQHSIYE